jgi:hypothetical protein
LSDKEEKSVFVTYNKFYTRNFFTLYPFSFVLKLSYMNRSIFLKTLGLGATGLVLPVNNSLVQAVKIYENYLKGVGYYDFKVVQKHMQIGDQVQLIREENNPYDTFAIAIYYHNHKLGYLPAYENIVLANMLAQGVALSAYITHINPAHYHSLAVEVHAQLITTMGNMHTPHTLQGPADDAPDEYRGIGVSQF